MNLKKRIEKFVINEMLNWNQAILNDLHSAVQNDSYWSEKIESITYGDTCSVSIHLAVLVEPYLQYILDGRKTIESRFSVRRYPPYNKVDSGDVLLLKRSSGPVVGLCEVTDRWFYYLDPDSWSYIRNKFSKALCATDHGFWQDRKNASFATLMRIQNVLSIKPFKCEKRDRRGWVILKMRQEQLGLVIE